MKTVILESRCLPNEVALNPGLLATAEGYLIAKRIDGIDPTHVDVAMNANIFQFWGHSHVRLEETDRSFKPTGRELQFSDGQDPRLFNADGGGVYLAFCRAWRQWVMPVKMSHHFEQFGEAITPDYERNPYVKGRAEKNWTWIDGTADSLDCIYCWEPFTALRFDVSGCCIERYRNNRFISPWRNGAMHGSTPSVLLPSGLRFSVFHSHLGSLYSAGGVYHRPEWPYEPVKVLCKPLLVGGNPRFIRWPLMVTGQRCQAVFPCGLVAKADSVLVSYGIGDCACAVAEFSYEELKDYDTAA